MKQFLHDRFVKSWKSATLGVVILILLITGTLDKLVFLVNTLFQGAGQALQGLVAITSLWLTFKRDRKALEKEIREEIDNETPEQLARGFDRATDSGKR